MSDHPRERGGRWKVAGFAPQQTTVVLSVAFVVLVLVAGLLRGTWRIALLGLVVFALLFWWGARLWWPAHDRDDARFHMGVGFASGGLVTLAVFILGLVDSCNTTATEEQRQVELLVSQRGGNLTGIDLHDKRLKDVYLQGRLLREAKLTGATLTGATLTGAKLVDADLGGAHLRGSNLEHAFLMRSNLDHADLTHADLDSAHLSHAGLTQARLVEAQLVGARLGSADLGGADLRGATLIQAKLADASLRGAHLEHAQLQYAHLRGSDLIGAHLDKADLTGADLAGVAYDKTTDWDDAHFTTPPGRPPRWPPPACAVSPCYVPTAYSPAYELRQTFKQRWGDVVKRMKALRKLLIRVSPPGWEARFGDTVLIELDSITKATSASGSEPPPSVATLQVGPAPALPTPAWQEQAMAKFVFSSRQKRYSKELDGFKQIAWTTVTVKPLWFVLKPRPRGQKKPLGYMRRYLYVKDKVCRIGVDLYYADDAVTYAFQSNVDEAAYIRYRPDLKTLFWGLGVRKGLDLVLYRAPHGKEFECEEGSSR